MAKTSHARTMWVTAAAGVFAALLVGNGAAQDRPMQDARRVRPVRPAQLLELAPLPELVLLPEPVPFPLQVPIAADQIPPQPQPQPPQPSQALEPARPLRLEPPSEGASPQWRTPIREVSPPLERTPGQISTGAWIDLPPPDLSINPKDHPAVGAYFGKAIQVCAAGVAPSACANGQQAGVLFMNPVLTGDGLIIADDSLTLLGAPFGPHACAHGVWQPISSNEFTAEYTFITGTYPPETGTISGLRARWLAQVLDADTLIGWVNAYFLPPSPVAWTPLTADQFPVYPPEALGFVTAPNGFVKDPATCMTTGCPQVFKFTLKRIKR